MSRRSNEGNLGDGYYPAEFSLTIVLYSKDLYEVERLVGEFAGVFTNADGSLLAETKGHAT